MSAPSDGDRLRLISEQVRSIVGCPESTLKDLTRKKGTRLPFITPVEPAKGSGQKDRYSWGDVVKVGLAVSGIERRLIRPLLFAASNINNIFSTGKAWKPGGAVTDPFSLNFLEPFYVSSKESKFQSEHLPQVRLWIAETLEFFVIGIDYENLKWFKGSLKSVRRKACLRKKGSTLSLLEVNDLSTSERKEINEADIIRTSVSLNKLHGKLRATAERLGMM